MTPLPDHLRVDGFDLRLLKREGDIALLEKSKKGYENRSYEVVRIQHHPDTHWPDGRITPAREALPSNEQWGDHGWSYRDEDEARAKYFSLLQ